MNEEVRTTSDESAEAGEAGGWRNLEIPEIGLKFTPMRSRDYMLFTAVRLNGQNTHIYSIRLNREGEAFVARLENDGREICSMSTTLCRSTLMRMAVSAFKSYVRQGSKTMKRLHRAAEAGMYHTPPEALEAIAGERPLDAVLADPPLAAEVADAPAPVSPGAPEMGEVAE